MILNSVLQFPYTVVWNLVKLLSKDLPLVIYCYDLTEWQVLEPVYAHLPEAIVVSGKKNVIDKLKGMQIRVKTGPVFPKAVIMCRKHTGLFPCKQINKIGLRFGAYHFKGIKDNYLSKFSLFLFSSQADLEAAQKKGITCGKVGGFPKLDPAFNGFFDTEKLSRLKEEIGIDSQKTTILLSATWYRSDASAVIEWYKRLNELTNFYNVLVTVHPKMDKRFIKRLKKHDEVYFIGNDNIVPYIMVSDVCISDTSSMIAEFSALDKPIITFRIPHTKKLFPQTIKIINKISYRINHFQQLIIAIEYSIKNRSELAKERSAANEIFFDKLDGEAGKRSAGLIKEHL